MSRKIKGFVDAKSDKFNGGLKIQETWYNGTKDTAIFVKKVNKGSLVELEIDDNNKIQFVKVIEDSANGIKQTVMPDVNTKPDIRTAASEIMIQEEIANVIENNKSLMKKCKEVTDEIFGNDEKYKDFLGQHCNSLYISTERNLRSRGLI